MATIFPASRRKRCSTNWDTCCGFWTTLFKSTRVKRLGRTPSKKSQRSRLVAQPKLPFNKPATSGGAANQPQKQSILNVRRRPGDAGNFVNFILIGIITDRRDNYYFIGIVIILYTMKATWHGATLAESDDTVVVEGNHYFPANSINSAYFRESAAHTTCPWKGEASYHDIVVNGDVNKDAAWYYPNPKEAALNIKDRIAFWKSVVVE